MPVQVAKRLFDVDEYHRMAETGILSEDDRVELIDGEIVAMTPIGPRHNAAVNRANRALVSAVGDSAIVQIQGSVRLNRLSEPEPDIVLLRPRADFYASHLPGPADILLVVEVAESSLEYDREIKARVYAENGVREYWLVDVDRRLITRFTDPGGGGYQSVGHSHPGEMAAPSLLPDCSIAVESLLP